MRNGKITNDGEYWMSGQFQNSLIFGILIVFQIEKKTLKFVIFAIWTIPKICNSEISKNL